MTELNKLITVKRKGKTDDFYDGGEQKEFNDFVETYHSLGYKDSIDSLGNPKIFLTCLSHIFQQYKDKCRENDLEQEKLKSNYQESLNRHKNNIDRLQTMLELKEHDLENLNDKIQEIDKNIIDVKMEPSKFGIDVNSKPKAQFYIGLLVLLPITLYLVVFYMSASFSAFFKEFNSDSLQLAIFDANAFMKAYNDGVLETIFVSTIPFAFMGLGYLIHMFQKEKKSGRYKVILLFIVTFIFDLILAYQIELKIYNINRTLDSPDFNLSIAFQSPEFWGIIFAGFVVYVIWGLVFDFIMKEYDDFDKINMFIKKLKDEKEKLLNQSDMLKEEINKIKVKLTEVDYGKKNIQAQLDGFIFPKKKYLVLFSEYKKGWYMAIQKEIILSKEKKDELINMCEEIAKEHLRDNSLFEDTEQIIYT
jgi:hypothetical protein